MNSYRPITNHSITLFRAALFVVAFSAFGYAQSTVRNLPRAPLGDGPWVFDTAEQHKIKVSVITKTLQRPFGLVFLPDGAMVVTERPGRLRVIRDGVLDPTPVPGLPPIYGQGIDGLFDIALHPDFARNHLIYFAYTKPGPNKDAPAHTLARATFDGHALSNVQELFAADWGTSRGGSRLVFAPDNTIYMTVPAAVREPEAGWDLAQNTMSAYGKILRFNDDGTVPHDNRLWRSRVICRRSTPSAIAITSACSGIHPAFCFKSSTARTAATR